MDHPKAEARGGGVVAAPFAYRRRSGRGAADLEGVMPKTVGPGQIEVPGVGTFVADAVPDLFDERDLEYRPRLMPLPSSLDARRGTQVLRQDGNSCTGHAVAAVVNTVLAHARGAKARGAAPRVSPYMLYRLARRYDEFEGERDEGSSLRGALKGWFNHGLLLDDDWPDLNMDPEPDLDDEAVSVKCRERPLGAYYRVNPFRLDDLQSAITELNGIVVSAVVHDGWATPVELRDGRGTLFVIRRTVDARSLGGHAFALVGYNDVGFLVQNSWGGGWGKGGFATLPYEDWLDTAYDAWVVRPGVPKTPFASGRSTKVATSGDLATAPGPDLRRLAVHVINLGNNGKLSTTGAFVSTPAQVDRVFDHMERWHDFWREREPGLPRHVMLYAHGGLNSEGHALSVANANVNWWLNNRIYPIFFAWQSGPAETLMDQLVDVIKGRRPPAGIGFDLVEQFDRLVERFARTSFRWMWDEMKENARAASAQIGNRAAIAWPPTSSAALDAMADMPGGSLTISRLDAYAKKHAGEVAIHLAGHSAGSIFHAALLQRLVEARLKVASMAMLAPAIRADEFARDILPHLGAGGAVERFSTFALSDRRELDDVCGAGRINIYQKSLLYLVSRALERAVQGEAGEVPLLGMERFFDRQLPGAAVTLRQAITGRGGVAVFSRSAAPADCRTDATSHGGFSGDPQTMTSVVMRALRLSEPRPENDYQTNAALRDTGPEAPVAAERPAAAPVAAAPAPRRPAARSRRPAGRRPAAAGRPAADRPLHVPSEVHEPGAVPLVETAEPQVERPSAPDQAGLGVEVAVAPRTGSPTLDVLLDSGYEVVSDGEAGGDGGAQEPG
jgi:hypothetical protein